MNLHRRRLLPVIQIVNLGQMIRLCHHLMMIYSNGENLSSSLSSVANLVSNRSLNPFSTKIGEKSQF